jgi:RNA polymerase sigma-70 factor (ECF subfamily)
MRTAVSFDAQPLGGTTTDRGTSDADLVVLAKRDPQAFDPLYDRYVDRVYRYCYGRLGNQDDAEDATSQVFTKALAALPGCREDRFRSWLFSIAHNVIVDNLRVARTDRPLEDAHLIEDTTTYPEELAIAADDRRTLRLLLDMLPADQRRVVELRLAELTGLEIAALLGRSHAAVKMLQARAVARLRAGLTGDPNAEMSHGAD